MMGGVASPGKGFVRRGVVGVAIGILLALATPASAQLQVGARADESAFWSEAGWGAGAACDRDSWGCRTPPTELRFRRLDLSVAKEGGCGIQLDDTLVCWGRDFLEMELPLFI